MVVSSMSNGAHPAQNLCRVQPLGPIFFTIYLRSRANVKEHTAVVSLGCKSKQRSYRQMCSCGHKLAHLFQDCQHYSNG